MLAKLIKHEWKETWRIPALIFGAILLLTTAYMIYFSLCPPLTDRGALHVGNLFLFIAFCFAISAGDLLCILYFGIRFYKNLFTDEGYLMHTLPVSPDRLLLSKTAVATIWTYVYSLLLYAIILPVTFFSVPRIQQTDLSFLEEFGEMLAAILGGSPLSALAFLLPYTLAGSIYSIVQLYAAASLGQFFGRHKVFGSIVCYLGLHTLFGSVTSLFMLPSMTKLILDTSQLSSLSSFTVYFTGMFRQVLFVEFLSNLAVIAACLFLCHYILKKNLNLD